MAGGVIHLGLTPAVIGEMTPRQMSALWCAWKEREAIADRRAALMPWLYAESNRDRKKRSEPFTVDDFMPGAREVAAPDPLLAIERSRAAFEAGGIGQFGVKSRIMTPEEFQSLKRYTK